MNWNNIETGWNDFKASAKQQWGKLSDQQISDTKGKREQLTASVQSNLVQHSWEIHHPLGHLFWALRIFGAHIL